MQLFFCLVGRLRSRDGGEGSGELGWGEIHLPGQALEAKGDGTVAAATSHLDGRSLQQVSNDVPTSIPRCCVLCHSLDRWKGRKQHCGYVTDQTLRSSSRMVRRGWKGSLQVPAPGFVVTSNVPLSSQLLPVFRCVEQGKPFWSRCVESKRRASTAAAAR